ncbi:HRDC domain-containing protein [Azospirillum doebereinerae]|uniref:Aldolase n=1 Tax=Azospirillum doebereinerae TaxID=92933 RepID=A0A433J2X5_9PROT|nr:HRDC domain-containing protein [Azospirillum doebereinerae]MCG5242165.1 HRDC domain-containing protein [Azospirillum doebereinerae]RUQ66058.1 aldolase [Azospirillum doebereinerae]
MSTEIRTFTIPDRAADEAQAQLSAFLRTVEVQRIDTAYAVDGWRVLVLFTDLKRKEESQQIEAAIAAAVNGWRDRTAAQSGLTRDAVLADDLVQEIARFAPTTEHELGIIVGARDMPLSQHGGEIVQVVRSTLDQLID